VDQPRPGLLPAPRHGQRVVVIDRLAVVIALVKAHAAPAPQVDRRDHQHQATPDPARVSTPASRSTSAAKLASKRRPLGPLFSGWNCTAMTAPRPTAETN